MTSMPHHAETPQKMKPSVVRRETSDNTPTNKHEQTGHWGHTSLGRIRLLVARVTTSGLGAERERCGDTEGNNADEFPLTLSTPIHSIVSS